MFYTDVNTNDRNAMIQFLKQHFRYYTLNSWNQSTSYANNVKLQNLNIPKDKWELAFKLIFGEIECDDYELELHTILSDFTIETGYAIGFNGRRSGYLVLYDTAYCGDKTKPTIMPGHSIDQYEDFDDPEEWSDQDLKNRVTLVSTFDKTCDAIRDMFLNILNNYEEITEKK